MKSISEYMNELIQVPFDSQYSKLEATIKQFESIKETPDNLQKCKAYGQKLRNFLNEVSKLSCSLSLNIVVSVMSMEMQKEVEEWMGGKQSAIEQIDNKVTAIKESIEAENKAHNEVVRAKYNSKYGDYSQLEEKRKTLEQYSDKIFDMCSRYNISLSMLNIDATTFSPEELNKLYDEYIQFMQKEKDRSFNPVTFLRKHVASEEAQGIILLVALALCYTPLLDLLSVGFVAALAYNQIKNVKTVKYYSILAAIVYNIKPEDMGCPELDESELLPEEFDMDKADDDERFAGIEEEYDKVENDWDEKKPDKEHSRILAEWSDNLSSNNEYVSGLLKKFNDGLAGLKSDIQTAITDNDKLFEKLKSEFKFLGQRFSNRLVFNDGITLGLHDGYMEESVNIGQRNIIIRPVDNPDLMKKFIQVLYVNIVSNVMPGKMTVDVYDPNDFGRSLMPFYSNDIKEYLNFYNDNLSEVIEKDTQYVQDNFKFMGGKTVDEYNASCEESGKSPIAYRALIILSQPKSVEENEKLLNFLKYSITGGVLMIVISDTINVDNVYEFQVPFEGVRHPIASDINDDWCYKFRTAYVEAVDNAKPKALLWKDFQKHIIPDDKTWTGDASRFIDFYPGYENGDPELFKPYTLGNEGNVHAIGVGTSGAGKSVFLNHLLAIMCRKYDPKQLELWLCDFKGVEFKAYMRQERFKVSRLCKPVEADKDYKCVKTDKMEEVIGYYSYNKETGEYSYSDKPTADTDKPHLFIYDIKNGKRKCKNGKEIPPKPKPDPDFKDNLELISLPHIAACLCTSDGDFATSLFHAYRTKADNRYADMGVIGVKNMPGWNTKVMALLGTKKPQGLIEAHGKEPGFNPIWTEDDLWPRVLFVCDEFQVIFQKADSKNVDKIKADITQIAKVARACGMHIFFTSQSMKGTISADILANFTLRFALRCEASVSQDIIGSTRAAEIREKNGYLIVQSQEMKTAEDQKRYRTPFLCDDEDSGKYMTSELFDNIFYLDRLAKERGYKEKDVISYQESTKHPISQLGDFYAGLNPETVPDSGLFVFGPRMAYSENKAPDNVIVGAKNNTNFMCCASEYNDYVLLFNQLMFCINHNKVPGTVIINSQVADLSYITIADKYITNEQHKELLSEKKSCAEITDWITKVVASRRERNVKDTPIWIFLLGWDKGKGFAIDADMGVRQKMTTILQTAGEFNIHLIFLNSGMTGIPMSLVSACAYRVAAKCSMDDSVALIETKQASLIYEGIPNGWIFVKRDGAVTRDKLYVSEIEREIKASEIIM